MSLYWLMFALPVLLALTPGTFAHGRFNPLWIGVGFFLVMVIGLRYDVGGDWDPYWNNFLRAIDTPLFDFVIYYKDPGYWFFNWLFANAGLGIWAQNLLFATLSVSGVMAVAKRQPLPWVALAIAVPYIMIVVAMGYVRQAAALGLVCWALLAVEDKRQWRFLFLALVAATFHKSAVVIFPFYLFSTKRIRLRHWVVFGVAFPAVFAVLIAETLESKWVSYVVKEKESEGALIRVAMNLLPALLLLIWRKRLGLQGEAKQVWFWLALASIGAFFLVDIATTAVDRIALYLLPLQMVVFSRLYLLFDMPVFRAAALVAVILFYFIVQFVWLNYAKHADDWVPYQFYPMVGVTH